MNQPRPSYVKPKKEDEMCKGAAPEKGSDTFGDNGEQDIAGTTARKAEKQRLILPSGTVKFEKSALDAFPVLA